MMTTTEPQDANPVKSAYLAAPIDLAHSAGFSEELDTISRALSDAGCSVFSPKDAWTVGSGQPSGALQRVNEAALLASDAAVFVLPDQPTVGVVAELTLALKRGDVLNTNVYLSRLLVVVDVSIYTRSWSLARLLQQVQGRGGSVLVCKFGEADLDEVYDFVARYARFGSLGVVHVGSSTRGRSEGAGDTNGRRGDTFESTDDRLALPFAVTNPDNPGAARLPSLANSQDAGLDLHVSEEMTIEPGQFVDVPCGIGVELPERSWALLTGRSSTFRKHGLLVINGVIDEGYRGELFAGVVNLGDEPVVVQQGQRLAQLIVVPRYADFKPVLVKGLSEGERGGRGFGSSGV